MAYAAVISLKQTIHGLLNSSHISLVSSSREILELAFHKTTSLHQVLETFNSNSMRSSEVLDDLDGQIRDCAHSLEDVLEFYESRQREIEEVRQELTSFAERVKKMEEDYLKELFRPLEEDDDDDAAASVSSDLEVDVEMVGRSDQFAQVQDNVLNIMRPDDMCFISYVGEIGSGRTVVAKALFEDLRNGEEKIFDCGAWVTIGTEYQLKEVLISILAQVDDDPNHDYSQLMSLDEEMIRVFFYKTLEDRKYMIVLDDVRDVQAMDYLRSSFSDRSNGSLVFVTTHLLEVAQSANCLYTTADTSFRDATEHDWFVLSAGIFSDESSLPKFEEAGLKITENCRGLRIAYAKTCLFLSRAEKKPELWRKIAADKENPIFVVRDEISEIREIKKEMQSYNWPLDHNGKENFTVTLISWFLKFETIIARTKTQINASRLFSRMKIISLLGMAGIGKSTYAKKISKDESVLSRFDHCVWVTLGPKYQAKDTLIDILAQIYPRIDKNHIKGDEKLARDLCAKLSCMRCLIVLDDLWSKEPLHHLKTSFPDIKGIALVTTRLAKVAKCGKDDISFEIPLLNKEESWCLLCQQLFDDGLCPPELEKAGRKIAENCDGLPLLILKVADQLLKEEKDLEYWNNVASGKQSSVFMNAHDEISKALLPSYKILPHHLKACFLYMGVFRYKYEIPTSMLTNLWIADGFLEPKPPQNVEEFVAECLLELTDRSLLMVKHKVSGFQIKTCRLHSVFWHLSNSEAVKSKFFHAMDIYDDCLIESINSQRRLCIRNSTLLGLQDVQNSMASLTTTHFLLCVGPPHQYPVSINYELRLLRVMDALTIRLYEFPVEVVKLFHLRYLGLTCNGKLPTSISQLWKLQYLIVSRYMNIKSFENSSPLPVEIWDMKELKHLQIMGGRLPNPKCGAGLPKLSTLLDVSPQSCTKKVLKRMPNLKRLGIRIELAPNEKGNPFRCLNRISRLRRLESLKCVVVNPQIRSEVAPPPIPVSMFPSSLKTLSLSGFGYPSMCIGIIGELENLEVLKLKNYAFLGPKWVMDYDAPFWNLKFLLIEDTDLVHWEIKSPIFQNLERLRIKHCYKLQELPTCFSTIYDLSKVEFVDCNPVAVTSAEKMRKHAASVKVEAHLSWMAKTKRHEEEFLA